MPGAQSVTSDTRYAVVICPRCRHALGVDRDHATKTCGRCHARHTVADLRTFYLTGDPDALRHAVGVVEAKVQGGDAGLIDVQALEAEIEAARPGGHATPPPPASADDDTIIQYAAAQAAQVESKAKKAERIFAALDACRPEGFTLADAVAAFEAATLDAERAEKEIRRGLVQDELFEPRPGRWRLLG